MTNVEQQFLQFWSNNEARVALWADSSYGPLEEKDILKLAKEVNFPIVTFNCSFGGGLTVKGDFHDPAGKPEAVVIIEMGYNDESEMSSEAAVQKMRQQQWYKVLSQSTSVVKFVIFIQQPSYRQVCPPKKKNFFNSGWTKGTMVEGAKYTEQAMQLCQQELRIPALNFECRSVQEMFSDMLIHKEGEVWQNEAVSRCAERCTKKGPDYNKDGQLALWEDSYHPTALGAEVHFRCLAKALQARWVEGGFSGGAQLATQSAAQQVAWTNEETSMSQQVARNYETTSPFQHASGNSAVDQEAAASFKAKKEAAAALFRQMQQASTCQSASPAQASWQSQEAWSSGAAWNAPHASWQSNGQARSQPY
jgi:hypothetical protein